ncbi:response regulator receiver protein [Hyphomicrobium denitrificans 1NES1]|uniref:Response regulator receiver protein n=1 Tax=Hyphomicrobium denitrificans 1NES1 TaxID=670307 RepID=N0B4R6_9HYPH|nr:response regulator [Hyphomicrobium denitrificans]AGK57983.1 response regulator receiver protein [Hyphomicrobium denitrificans 1NES1]
MDSFRTDQPIEILIVDDEPQAVKYFKKAFGTKYDVLTATSADEAEALVLSGNHNIGLVITDQRMPGRSGVSLLNRIRNERPDIIRMLTTAYADLDSAIDAVNKGEILRYISKPWDLRVLEAEIDQAITFFLLKNEYDLLLRDKLSALHRTLLRDRMNGLAVMAGTLPYNNAPLTMYHYLKDALAEPCWRPIVRKQWSQLRVQDHWRIPVDETQRAINLTEDLMDRALFASNDAGASADLVAIASACADSINEEQGEKHVRISSDEDSIVVAASPFVVQSILQRLMEPASRWAAPGSTLQVNITRNDKGEAGVHLETRNCEPGKALQDSVLFTPAMQVTPKSASDFLKVALAIGHLGGSVSSPPMENGYKQIHVNLPMRATQGNEPAVFPTEWIEDLSSDYERWVLGTLDIAA